MQSSGSSSGAEGKDCGASDGGKEEAKGEDRSGGAGKQLVRGRWVPKSKAAFIQTPQDFFNVDASDPVRGLDCSLLAVLHAPLQCAACMSYTRGVAG